jgi:uncharacterized glyoxalase superfamily protein PhnB
MRFPAAVPEVPVKDSAKAVAHYVDVLGFTLDWHDEESGIAGVSRGDCRLFLTDGNFRRTYGNEAPALIWLNLENKGEVDELCKEWKAAQATLLSEPEDKPWKLREFILNDLDGNFIRVFYDFGTAERDQFS